MKVRWEHLVAIGAAVVVLLVAWFSGSLFHLAGLNRAILGIGILVIGAVAIAAFLMWANSQQPPKAQTQTQAPGAGAGATSFGSSAPAPASFAASGAALTPADIDAMVREAAKKVAAARLGSGTKIGALRQIFVLGECTSGKTEAVLHSGLDAELLAGQVFQEGAVIPTPGANFWFARKTVLIEAGPNVFADPRIWSRLVRRLAPGGLRDALGGKNHGERAAVVCFDCEKLVTATSTDALLGTARTLRSRLEEMSQVLGSSFPVYVLFTRSDRIPFFEDFVNTLTTEESTQVLGATLPAAADSPNSVYAERESRRLTAAFNGIFQSLADHRLDMLSRESNSEKRPGAYEHPREFSKINKRVVQFLVELCRPRQLRSGPFLRGFYFTGKRMVAASSSPSASSTVIATRANLLGSAEPAANATTILRQEDVAAALPNWATGTQIQTPETRTVPQWVFLSHIFSHVLLQDRSALGASGVSTRTDVWRRAIFAAVMLIAVIWIAGSFASYFSNRSLEADILHATQTLQGLESSSQQPTLESLKALDSLRQTTEKLESYENNGAPFLMRWGLYSGHDIFAEARRLYFVHFNAELFAQIQSAMADSLRRLPATPGTNDEYVPVYDTLKGYLITTSNPDKSTADFLSPVLQRNWSTGQNADPNLQALARTQFDFYANELKSQNPYSTQADAQARDHARDYLNRFGAVPRIYAAMQNAAAKQSPAVNFYREHPDATDVIRGVPEVPGAFTKTGWDFMQNAIAHSDQYFRGEEWVMGDSGGGIANRSDLEAQLHIMYQAEFIKRWQDFLKNAKVASYAGAQDGARKLKALSANESPLIALLCDASQNTAARSADVDKAFKPVQEVTPYPGCETRVPQTVIPYLAGLAKFQSCFENLAAAPPDQKDAQQQQCNSTASDAKLVVATQIALTLDKDPDGHMDQAVQALLEAPITGPAAPPPPKGASAKDLCASFAQIATKFPFNASYDAPDVSAQDFDAFFRPDSGALQQFVQANQAVLAAQGAQLALKPGAKVDWPPTFLTFLNRAHLIQQSLYTAGSGGPAQLQYRFSVKTALSDGGITGVTFTLNGQTLKYPGGAQTAALAWPGNGAQEARISYQAGGGQETDLLSAPGPWAMIRLLSLPGVKVTTSGSSLSAEWHALQADGRTPLTLSGTGKPIIVHLDFDGGAAPFIFQAGYFSNLSCRAGR